MFSAINYGKRFSFKINWQYLTSYSAAPGIHFGLNVFVITYILTNTMRLNCDSVQTPTFPYLTTYKA